MVKLKVKVKIKVKVKLKVKVKIKVKVATLTITTIKYCIEQCCPTLCPRAFFCPRGFSECSQNLPQTIFLE